MQNFFVEKLSNKYSIRMKDMRIKCLFRRNFFLSTLIRQCGEFEIPPPPSCQFQKPYIPPKIIRRVEGAGAH